MSRVAVASYRIGGAVIVALAVWRPENAVAYLLVACWCAIMAVGHTLDGRTP